jgi:hypothetical protein
MFTGMGWTSVALVAAISFLKILMVANFDWIYNQNPEQLGKLIVSLIYGLTIGRGRLRYSKNVTVLYVIDFGQFSERNFKKQ